jgi:hypothetical protein
LQGEDIMKVRNWKSKVVATLFAGGAVMSTTNNVTSADEVLDFVNGIANNANLQGSGYGNALATTPNININWNSAGWDQYNNWTGRTAVGQLDYNAVPDVPIEAIFTPDAGFGVFISSFDMDEWGGGGDTINNWELVGTGLSGTFDAFSTANDPSDAGGRVNVVTGMTAANAVFGPLTVRFTRVSGLTSYIAVDNIAFGQVAIPEPGALAILSLAGLGATLMRRRVK